MALPDRIKKGRRSAADEEADKAAPDEGRSGTVSPATYRPAV
jgi:hypothetical protein